ncbi:MAG: dihydroorotate dehydrogenase electron transfer subunit [Candidatus Aminicenantes bacterium]|nr:dihydroorotate dehydrogenase electron transfer subunit [Candidatus Aminicenantes bacterium]
MILDTKAEIVGSESWGDYRLLTIRSPSLAKEAVPGQFIMIRTASGPHPLLRRPFSIHDLEKDTIGIYFQIAGEGTALLAAKKPGSECDVIGPLGNGFIIDALLKGKTVAAVGGGRGIAPLFFLGDELRKKGIALTVYYGGRTSADLPLVKKFQDRGFPVHCSTDDGSSGFHGPVTELFLSFLPSSRPDHLFVCGPDPMMKALSRICLEERISAQFSLESIMGCGFGACWGCVHKIKAQGEAEWTKICQEGPVFFTEDIIWDND